METSSNLDQLIGDLIASRSIASGLSPEHIAREAMLRGLLGSPEDRTQEAKAIRDMTPGVLDDSTDLIRRFRDGP